MMPEPPDFIKWPLLLPEERVKTKGSGHMHWVVTAFQKLTDEGNMMDSVPITVEANSEEEAISRAQEILIRNHYRVSNVMEICSLDTVFKNG